MAITRLSLVALLLAACAQSVPTVSWQSPLYRDHPLAGRIWSSEHKSFVDQAQLWSAIDAGSYVLLGEKHDNPDHHQLQLQLLNQLIDRGLISRLTLEMLDSSSDVALAEIHMQDLAELSDLNQYLQWDNEGWDWNFYGPLIEAAYLEGLPIYSGNLDNESIGRIYGEPTPEAIEAVFDDTVMQRLFEDIDASHCGLLPESQFPAMVRVQQSRDFRMAQQLEPGQRGNRAVLIAGNYHVRHDLGVPNYLLAQNAALDREQIVSIAFLEVDPDETDPANYLDQFNQVPAYDFIWFTPAVTAEDYCDSLR